MLNGQEVEVDTWPGYSLLHVLREVCHLPGTKNACEQGECGSCSIWFDDKMVCACLVLAAQADGADVRTIESLSSEDLHPIQEAFVEMGAVQCGFCTPGFIVAAVDLLERHPLPDDYLIKEALSGNLCRCTGYAKIIDAVKAAAKKMHDEASS